MSVDILQDKIRRLKNPSMLDLLEIPMDLPLHILQQENTMTGSYRRFCLELLEALKDLIPAVRVPFSAFALLGPEGLTALEEILSKARQLGYYVALEAPEVLSPLAAQITAQALMGENSPYPCDGVILPVYAGSDVIKPFVPFCRKQDKDLFCVARTGNKSASELQDLLAGSRVVHMAAADLVNRYISGTEGKRGYAVLWLVGGVC